MDSHPYHHYLFFKLDNGFYSLSAAEQKKEKENFQKAVVQYGEGLIIESYATAGFKPDTTFMLWVRARHPEAVQPFLHAIHKTKFGRYLSLSYTYFGMVRRSEYSGRTGRPEQVIQNHEDRTPYLIVYPFTKTHEWHALDAEKRREIMGEHMRVGLKYPAIRQCLLYSYGVDDYEFVVSYETKSLEEFQDLVIEMRRTAGRKYTLKDTPTFTCVHKPLAALLELI